MVCVGFGVASGDGALCAGHLELLACPTLTSDQIQSDVRGRRIGWLLDQGGRCFAISAGLIGRGGGSTFSIVHASVSSQHAELRDGTAGVELVDLESSNGTFIGGAKISVYQLADGDLIHFGEVPLLFSQNPRCAQLASVEARQTVRTFPSNLPLAVDLLVAETVVKMSIACGQSGQSGQSGQRGEVRSSGNAVELGELEQDLLAALLKRRMGSVNAELAYIPSEELVMSLSFNAAHADAENLRELVQRVRRKLARAGLPNLIESRKGAGYRIAGKIA